MCTPMLARRVNAEGMDGEEVTKLGDRKRERRILAWQRQPPPSRVVQPVPVGVLSAGSPVGMLRADVTRCIEGRRKWM